MINSIDMIILINIVMIVTIISSSHKILSRNNKIKDTSVPTQMIALIPKYTLILKMRHVFQPMHLNFHSDRWPILKFVKNIFIEIVMRRPILLKQEVVVALIQEILSSKVEVC